MSRLSLRPAVLAPCAAALLLTLPTAAFAQGWSKRLKDAAKQAAGEVVEQKTREAARNGTEQAIDGAASKAGDRAASIVGVDKTVTKDATAGAAADAAPAKATARPGEGAWSNYDFKPGDRPLFVDDFAKDAVGDFPRRLEFKSGSAEIVEWQEQRWLSAPGTAEFWIPLGTALPERFTVEFDLAGSGNAMTMTFDGKGTTHQRTAGLDRLDLGTWEGGLTNGDRRAGAAFAVKTTERPVHVAVQVDGDYAKVYVDERRIANVPNAKLGRGNRLYMDLNGWDAKNPRMITNLRVMAGGKKLYDALSENGRVATQGIYFDVGSDRIRPESTPTLKEIAKMLQEHAELQLTIEGHTDATGQAAANLSLSEKRAAAVKAALVKDFGADAGRLEAKGLGQTKPIGANDTAEGRQQNRRVELVKR
jgi:outer membrane protein OmpA-like peptidoglycan-associated protein